MPSSSIRSNTRAGTLPSRNKDKEINNRNSNNNICLVIAISFCLVVKNVLSPTPAPSPEKKIYATYFIFAILCVTKSPHLFTTFQQVIFRRLNCATSWSYRKERHPLLDTYETNQDAHCNRMALI
jgi:hypothetical protein